MADDLPELLVPDAAAWRTWLAAHHATSPGVWLVLQKKNGRPITALTYGTALDEALCFGWIDGQARRRDEDTYWQRMTRRGPRSMWSARNVEHIARLEREGKMHEAGRAQVRAAQEDGRWERAYHGPAQATVPDDLLQAIAANPRAQAMFDVLTSQNRFALIHRLGQIRRADTRERRIAEMVQMLARHETFYSQRRMPD